MRYPNVIDLSHHNTLSSLQKAKDAGVWGVIHKLTEGTGFKDSQAVHHVPLVREAGLLLGLYHFIRPGNISKQIDFFLSTAAPLMDDDTLLCCDYEDAEVSLVDVLNFLTHVETQTGRSPVLYGGSILKEAILSENHGAATAAKLAKYRFWLAQYGPTAKLPKGFDKLWLWQYSETGKMAGITGNVDLDFFDGTQQELISQWSGKQDSAPAKSDTVPAVTLPANSTEEPTVKPTDTQTPLITPPPDPATVGVQQTQPATDPPDLFTRLQTKFLAIPAAILSALGAVGTWAQNSPIELTIALLGIGAAVVVIYIIGTKIQSDRRESRDTALKLAREAQAFELNRIQLNAAASKDLNPVQLVPSVAASTDSVNTGSVAQ
jgi:lysozyme